MKKKIVWLGISCLMVAALLLASCAPTAPTTPPTPTTPTAPATPTKPTTPTTPTTPTAPAKPTAPKYGGTFVGVWSTDHLGFDDALHSSTRSYGGNNVFEVLLQADWKKGPAGTGEYDYFTNCPAQAVTGLLSERWEIPDKDTVIFHIRKGVHWQNKPPVNGRELVAEDIAYNFRRIFSSPFAYLNQVSPGWFKSVTATDKYTVVIKAQDSPEVRTARLFSYLSHHRVVAPEVIEKYGNTDAWRNVVGTGPFILVDYVPASSYTLERNPNYWQHDPLHPENQLPYLDTVKWLIIPDTSTQLAALRTKKVDYIDTVGREDAANLIRTNPELQYKSGLDQTLVLFWRIDKPGLPFKDVRVRKALHMGVNLKAIAEVFYGGNADILSYPGSRAAPETYTPLEKMPKSIQELFQYNPEKAKQLLAEAGYPNGFKTQLVFENTPANIDLLSIVKDDWAKIGVDVTLDPREYSAFQSIARRWEHKEMVTYLSPNTSPQDQTKTIPTVPANLSRVNDPVCNDMLSERWKFENMADPEKGNEITRSYIRYVLEQAYYLQLPCPYIYAFWQPWVQNFHGELTLSFSGEYLYRFANFIWIDRDMKKKATGK